MAAPEGKVYIGETSAYPNILFAPVVSLMKSGPGAAEAEVTLTNLSTSAPHMAYDPHKLSMEKVESMFSPEDRMGALEMQNLSVVDNRAFLINHLESIRMLTEGPARRELTELLGDDTDAPKKK